jgi:chemotaxis protein methyltransferase CheR
VTTIDELGAELQDRTGLAYGGHQRPRMRRAIEAGMHREGCTTSGEYARRLRDDPAAFASLLDDLTVHETYFMRDGGQLDLIRSEVLDVHRREAGGLLRIWSAGCSTGEEAYTLAIEAAKAGLHDRVRVLGTDLSAAAIGHAEEGRYGPWSFRGVDEVDRRTWFVPDGERWRVRHDLRDRVTFEVRDLLDGAPARFQLVVCRNVLMYLTPGAVARASSSLSRALAPGGHLVIGASDPPLRCEDLVLVSTGSGLVYRRADDAAPVEVRSTAPPVADEPPASGVAAAARDVDSLEVLLAEIDRTPLEPRLRHLAASMLLTEQRFDEAIAQARAALYLDPRLTDLHVLIGHAHAALGHREASAKSYARAGRVASG